MTNQASEDDELQANVLEIIESHFKPTGNSLMPLNATKRIMHLVLADRKKQVEEAMAKFHLKKGVKYDVKASDSVIVITPSNKLKESK